METVERNAKQALVLHKTRRASDLTTRSRALEELQESLDLAEAPLRIEGFDVSHHAGDEVVASMVVFEDGLPRKSEYRRFAMRDVVGQNDVASIHEVISRRFRRLQSENEGTAGVTDEAAEVTASGPRDENGRPRRFAYPPQLVVVDGGPAQVNAAQRALDELGIVDVAVVGLAKRLEEVWQPGDENPVVLPRTSEALYLLQRLRDEAHRFAIGFHRQRRSKSMTTSALDAVPGLGEVRRKALMKQFGSLKRLRAASETEIATVPGIGPVLAAQVVAALAAQDAAPAAVNTATGELLE